MRNEVLISLAILLILIVFSQFFIKIEPPKVREEMVFKEEPLLKNKDFALHPGDTLVYKTTDNYSQNFSFSVAAGSGCIWLYIDGGDFISCVKKDGTDGSNSNISLTDKTIFFFKPWMLALNDSWKWGAQGCFVIDNTTNCNINISFQVIRVDYINGKKYYVVKETFGSLIVYDWVEDERRIVTREIGPGYEMELIE
jgi:hypothetical protein